MGHEECDRITRGWCRHLCQGGVTHVLEEDDAGVARMIYKHMLCTRQKWCCRAYKEGLRASA